MIGLFDKHRSRRDINLNLGASDRAGQLIYFMFNEPALNSFHEVHSKARESDGHYYITGRRRVKVDRLDTILGECKGLKSIS